MTGINWSAAQVRDMVARVQMGLYEEWELVRFIMEVLILPEQTTWLNQEGLEIADLLNGRFYGEQEPTIQAIFQDWNMQLPERLFKL